MSSIKNKLGFEWQKVHDFVTSIALKNSPPTYPFLNVETLMYKKWGIVCS